MPIVTIKLLARPTDLKAKAVKKISQVIAESLNDKVENVTIIFEETKPENWAKAGELRKD